MDTLCDGLCTFVIISHCNIHGMKNVADNSCKEKFKKHPCSLNFFSGCAIYEIMWKNMVEPYKRQVTV